MRFGFEAATSQDRKTVSSSSSLTNIFLDASAQASFNQDSKFFLTLGYVYSSSIEPYTSSTSANFVSSNPYGGISCFMGRDRLFGFGAYWMPAIQGSYSQTSTANEFWSGSGFYVKLMAQPEITRFLTINVSLIYYSATYTNKSGTTSVSEVNSFSRTYYSPMVGFNLKF